MKQQTVTRRLMEIMSMVIASDFEPDINTQAEFAGAMGVHPTAISRMLAGTADATVEQLVTACTRFKVSGNYLLLGRGDIFLSGHKLQNMNARIENKLNLMYEDLEQLKTAIFNQKPVTETRHKPSKIQLKRAR